MKETRVHVCVRTHGISCRQTHCVSEGGARARLLMNSFDSSIFYSVASPNTYYYTVSIPYATRNLLPRPVRSLKLNTRAYLAFHTLHDRKVDDRGRTFYCTAAVCAWSRQAKNGIISRNSIGKKSPSGNTAAGVISAYLTDAAQASVPRSAQVSGRAIERASGTVARCASAGRRSRLSSHWRYELQCRTYDLPSCAGIITQCGASPIGRRAEPLPRRSIARLPWFLSLSRPR